jgi:NACalpha-BTF3-like transcription factor
MKKNKINIGAAIKKAEKSEYAAGYKESKESKEKESKIATKEQVKMIVNATGVSPKKAFKSYNDAEKKTKS